MDRREGLRELLNEIRSIRQYIGARYVPKFIDDPWTDIIEYEALSVVSVGGTSYISGTTVPVGTPISDRNYWHIYGASSGAIINLQNQIDDMNDGDVPGSLQAQINTNASNITALTTYAEGDYKKYKKIVHLGDSYGTYPDSDGRTVAQGLINDGWDVVFEKSYGGAGFTKTGAYDIASYLSEYTGNKDEVTDVVFCCIGNDNSGNFLSIRNAVIAGINTAKSLYKNAEIHIFPWGVIFQNTQVAYNLRTSSVAAYRAACQIAGAHFVENARYIMRNTNLMQNDFQHPNTQGVANLRTQLGGYLAGNEVNVDYEISPTFTNTDTEITGFVPGAITIKRHNNRITLNVGAPSNTMFGIEHVDTLGGAFTPTAQGILMDASLVCIPFSYDNQWQSIHGYESFTVASGSPLSHIGATLRFMLYRDQFLISIIADEISYATKRFASTDLSVTFYDD